MPRTVKIAPEIDAKLYEELVSVAKRTGSRSVLCWSGRWRLPPQRRPLATPGEARGDGRLPPLNEKYRELYKKLAK